MILFIILNKNRRKYIYNRSFTNAVWKKILVTGTHTLDDVQETVNSFYTFDLVIDSLDKPLTLEMLKEWHASLNV